MTARASAGIPRCRSFVVAAELADPSAFAKPWAVRTFKKWAAEA
jgi:hypothetical protein